MRGPTPDHGPKAAKGTMMNRQSFMTIAAGVSVLGGLADLLAPAQTAALFGITFDDVAVSQARLLGAAYLGYAAIVWFARDVTDRAAARAIALGNAVSWAISAIITVTIIVAGLVGAQAWLVVAVEAVFAAAWASFAFAERTMVARA
jgi:hypothetical protein